MEAHTSTEVEGRRRPLSERGAATRRKLLDAAIELLRREGYGGTTTQAVMDLAGVSRGSLLHQFQTRLDLMAETARYAMEKMTEASWPHFERLAEPVARLEAYPDVLWQLQNEPPAAALTEIMLAARWDEGLAERLMPVIREVETSIASAFGEAAAACGLRDLPGLLTQVRMLIAATRGLSIDLTFNRDNDAVQAALDLLKQGHIESIRARLPA